MKTFLLLNSAFIFAQSSCSPKSEEYLLSSKIYTYAINGETDALSNLLSHKSDNDTCGSWYKLYLKEVKRTLPIYPGSEEYKNLYFEDEDSFDEPKYDLQLPKDKFGKVMECATIVMDFYRKQKADRKILVGNKTIKLIEELIANIVPRINFELKQIQAEEQGPSKLLAYVIGQMPSMLLTVEGSTMDAKEIAALNKVALQYGKPIYQEEWDAVTEMYSQRASGLGASKPNFNL